jgi:hypothetical protein
LCWTFHLLPVLVLCALQQMAQVLSGASLALLLVRLLQCKQPSRAADRGFHGRPSYCPLPTTSAAAGNQASSSRAGAGTWNQTTRMQQQQQYANRQAWQTPSNQQQQQQQKFGQAAAAAADAAGYSSSSGSGVLPCPVLYPWCDGRQDLQLSLMLMLMSSCSSEAGSFAEYGLEAVTQQVRPEGEERPCHFVICMLRVAVMSSCSSEAGSFAEYGLEAVTQQMRPFDNHFVICRVYAMLQHRGWQLRRPWF